MEDLSLFELPDLMDRLSEKTAAYMTMLRSGATREQFNTCRDEIQKIQDEIAFRKLTKEKTTPANVHHILTTQQPVAKPQISNPDPYEDNSIY